MIFLPRSTSVDCCAGIRERKKPCADMNMALGWVFGDAVCMNRDIDSEDVIDVNRISKRSQWFVTSGLSTFSSGCAVKIT